ncbi:MAG: efflux RND transporter permease subunit, partial [Candidatus Obscuribacterales bacterium]|nr:efflux RND transporter permease subunit [Candidatus Obscuribacterales bacterium]
MLNSLIKWSLNQKWLVTLLAAILLTAGVLTTFNIPIDVFPDFSPVQVVVLTEAPGYAPEEVESLVTLPLESALNGTANVQIVRSVSTIGLSVITIIFNDGTNIFTARQLVSEKLQTARSKLPPDTGQPTLAPITSAAGDVFKLGLYATGATTPMELRTLVDWTIRRRLMALPGVANVVVQGGEEKQYQILVDPNKLKQYDLTLQDVVEAATAASGNATGGFLRTAEQEHVIRGLGRATSVDELERAVITTRNGVPILLNRVAKVQIGGAFKIGDGAVNGHPGVVMMVIKQPWANTLELTRTIESAIEELKPGFPKDVQLVATFRQADFIEVAVKNILEALVLGAILVVLVLFLFLQNWRTAFISLAAIPLSLLTAVIALKFYGATINTMTLGGLAIALGEVVDDAIIDVENVYRRLRENKASLNPKSTFRVIYQASTEIRGSVVYATFIVALVFVP